MTEESYKTIYAYGLPDFFINRVWVSAFPADKTFKRAEGIVNSGKVLEFTCGRGDERKAFITEEGAEHVEIKAKVQGTRLYHCDISLSILQSGEVIVIPRCSCPVGFKCKHTIATLELISRKIEEFNDEVQLMASSQDLAVESWLKEVEHLGKTQEDIDLKMLAKSKQKTYAPLGFLITRSRFGVDQLISYLRVLPEKGGEWYEVHNADLRRPGKTSKYLRNGDAEIITLIEHYCPNLYHEGNVLPEGTLLSVFLDKLMATGRLFLTEDYGVKKGQSLKALKWAPEVHTELGWKVKGKTNKLPVLTPSFRLRDFWNVDPFIHYNEKAETLQKVHLPSDVSPLLAERWCDGPPVREKNFSLLEKSKVVQKRAPIGSELIERELKLPPQFTVEVTREKNRAHYTHLRLSLKVQYDGVSVGCSEKKSTLETRIQHEIISEGEDRIQQLLVRDATEEKKAFKRMTEELGFIPYGDVQQWKGEGFYDFHQREYEAGLGKEEDFSLPHTPEVSPRAAEALFYTTFLPVAEELGWEVIMQEGEEVPEIQDLNEEYGNLIEEQDETGINWFRFDTGFVNGEGAEISMHEALADFISRVDLDALEAYEEEEKIIVEDPETSRIYRIPARRFLSMAQKVRDLLRGKEEKMDRVRAAVFADDFQLQTSETFKALAELGKKLKSITEIPMVKLPRNLKAELRPYQKEGFYWLQFLHDHGLNGILADDMGLGKTLQTIAHLLTQHNKKEVKTPSLVIAPTSVTTNWMREMEKFSPKLKTVLLQGKERHEHWEKLQKYDVVVTSYALTVRDEERLKKEQFHTIVLDEAQYIKNSKAKVSRVVCELACVHRLCLSGTPLENHLGELWSLSRFLMPGLLGDEKSFREDFRTPIEKHADSEAQLALTRKVKPLMLRRTKEEVATELPKKTEITNTVSLGDEQTALYEAIRAMMDQKVREAISAKGVSQSQIVFLEALLKLRQTCCDPRLLKDDKSNKVPSAKFAYLTTDLLPALLEEGRKILLFSQFTTMLGLIEEHLKTEKIPFAKLTGATRKREEQIQKFQEGEAQIFLISLKAGGTGLNLTAADTVIHYDPWWNPAAENQATDRAHRMGQTKPVFVHRLICEGSIEERIQELQKQKSDLADSLLSGSMKKVKLDEKTLSRLLAPLT